MGAIGVEVGCADPAGADKGDANRTVFRHRRTIRQLRRRRFGGRLTVSA